MTITYYFTSDYERCSRLAFGVPLEDSFPADDIHPSLKELFVRAHENIALCGHPIDQIISKLQGSIEERLSIKEGVVLCKPMAGVVSPGALLWVIRHFVGLIPVPLLSRYTDSKTFNWIGLSQFCKRAPLRCSQRIGGGDKLLAWKIAEELLRLPFPNLLLFSVLINFIRALTTKKQRLNKEAALCLIRYFCSSIFVRPYHPDCNRKAEILYAPFLFFVVLKWPEVERAFQESALGSPRNIFDDPGRQNFEWHFRRRTDFGSNSSKTACTQTDGGDDEVAGLSTISEESLEDERWFLKDVACQTEFDKKKRRQRHESHRCCCRYGSNYETSTTPSSSVFPEDKEVQTEACDESDEDFSVLSSSSILPRSCGWVDPEKVFNLGRSSSILPCSPRSSDRAQVISVGSNTSPGYGWVNPAQVTHLGGRSTSMLPRSSDRAQVVSVGSNTSPDCGRVNPAQEINLGRSISLLPCSSRSSNRAQVISVGSNTSPYYGWVDPAGGAAAKEEIHLGRMSSSSLSSKADGEYFDDDDYTKSNLDLLATPGVEKGRKRDPKILGRLSKIGWTYTPPASSTDDGGLTPSKTALKQDNYVLFFNDKEEADRDEKDVCSLSSQDCCVEGELLGKSASASSTKSKRSFSLGKIRSGLDLFRFFSKQRKAKLTNSSSLEEVSGIKYKKMNSVRSTVF